MSFIYKLKDSYYDIIRENIHIGLPTTNLEEEATVAP
jgi:hypothetical protein